MTPEKSEHVFFLLTPGMDVRSRSDGYDRRILTSGDLPEHASGHGSCRRVLYALRCDADGQTAGDGERHKRLRRAGGFHVDQRSRDRTVGMGPYL